MISRWRRARLVSVAEFDDRTAAETAWARLQDSDVPALVETDPGALGGRAVTRLMVQTDHVEAAQRILTTHAD